MASPTRPVRVYRWRSRLPALLAISVVMTVVMTACGGGASTGSSAAALEEQTWLVPQDWGAIDPTKTTATNTGTILLALEPLVLADGKGGVLPNLAAQTTPNPTTYVYSVRPGVKFSDGTLLTMDDVLYSFEIHTKKGSDSALAGDFSGVTSIARTGQNQLTITLSRPNIEFPNYVAQVGIVEKSVREKQGSTPGSPGHLNVGTGPYTVTDYQPGNQVVLARNESYWGTKPTAKKITLRLIQDDSARLLAVQSGSVTGAFEIPAAQVPVYSRADGMTVIKGPNPSTTMLSFNTTRAPWNDIHVRRAVTMAIDKAGIVNAVLSGNGIPAASIVQRTVIEKLMPAADADALYAQLDPYPHDPAAAKVELARSATPTGFTGQLVYSQAEPSSGLVAQAVAQQLAPLGINLTVSSLPDSQYTDEVFFKHTAPPAIVDFTTDIPDPISLPNYLSNSVNTLAKGGYTDIGEYSNPAQDQLLDQYLRLTTDQTTERASLLSRALRNLAADQPYVPIYNANYLAVVKKGLTFENFDGMWWMQRWPNLVAAAT